jgi:hypothetical protein
LGEFGELMLFPKLLRGEVLSLPSPPFVDFVLPLMP